MNRGRNHWNAKLDDGAAAAIRQSPERQSVLAAIYGVNRSQISRIRAGLFWKDHR